MSLVNIPAYQSARLVLSALQPEDWPLFLGWHQQPEILRYVSDPQPEAHWRHKFQLQLQAMQQAQPEQWSFLVSRGTGPQAIGLASVRFHPQGVLAEIGFMLDPSVQGLGYGSELVEALIQHVFGNSACHKLIAVVTAGNQASAHILRKYGFVQEGCLRQQFLLAGQFYDDWVFGLLRHDWQPQPL